MIIESYFVTLFSCVLSAPNFVFVLTDDQDLTLRSLEYMNKTIRNVANRGMTFTNFFVNSPVCCPSRSTILTGRYAHNCHVYNNSVSGGCSSREWQDVHESTTIASILKSEKNYTTFYAGKYLNQYGETHTGGTQHVPKGYDWWVGLVGNSKYYNYTLSINGSSHFFQNDYFTDKINQYALDFLNSRSASSGNFFMILAPPACHAPFTPAPRHAHLFPDLKTVRNPPFNYTPINKHWLVEMPPLYFPRDVANLDEIYANRLRTLQAVDEMIEDVMFKLKEMDLLDNTYIIFTSDNGFHIGQFVQPWDKRQPYESDIHVPFMITGPNIPRKTLSEFPISAVDILPTILDLAGIHSDNFDGTSFKNRLFTTETTDFEKNVLVEYWGESDTSSVDPKCPWKYDTQLSECLSEAWCKCQDSKNNTYSCVVHISSTSKFKVCAFEDGFIEAYDLIQDPLELYNLKSNEDRILRILKKLKNCRDAKCKIQLYSN